MEFINWVHLQPPRDSPSRLNNYTKYIHEIKIDKNYLTDTLQNDDIEKLNE